MGREMNNVEEMQLTKNKGEKKRGARTQLRRAERKDVIVGDPPCFENATTYYGLHVFCFWHKRGVFARQSIFVKYSSKCSRERRKLDRSRKVSYRNNTEPNGSCLT